jgi:hypothetical protein
VIFVLSGGDVSEFGRLVAALARVEMMNQFDAALELAKVAESNRSATLM